MPAVTNFTETSTVRQGPDAADSATPRGAGCICRRLAADLRPPLVALAVLAALMSVAFPLWRLMTPRETYILHLSDDAFYYFSVAPNIAAGLGPTADGITRTTGWHPLYGFILAGLHCLTNPSLDGFVKEAIALNAGLYLLAGYFLYRAGRQAWGKPAGWAAALLWLTNPYGVLIAAQGLESALYGAGLALLIWRLLALMTSSSAGRPRAYLSGCLLLGLWAGLVVLSRTDSILLMPLLALMLLAGPRVVARQTRLAGVALFSILVLAAYGAWLLYVRHYTGEFHQGSAAVKMEWRKYEMGRLTALGGVLFVLKMWGEYVLKTFLKVPALKWLLAGIPLLSRARHGGLPGRRFIWVLAITPVVLGAAYSLLLDWTRAWYYLPGLLTLTFLSAGAAAALLNAGTSCGPVNGSAEWPVWCDSGPIRLNRLQLLAAGTAGLIAWAVVIESAVVFGTKAYDEISSDSEKVWALEMADWMERNVEPGSRIGVWHSGIVGYYTPNMNVINLDGLNNNDILQVLRGRKTLPEYVDEIGLQLVVSKGRDKMGTLPPRWGTRRLAAWDRPPRRASATEPPSVEDQILPQYIQRIVEAGEPSGQ